MEFKYTSSIYISPEDLERMYQYVKKGGYFPKIFDIVMAECDDDVYYNSYLIRDDVEKEIQRRLEAENN